MSIKIMIIKKVIPSEHGLHRELVSEHIHILILLA